ncbi:MFS transporter [Ensifer sp.]|uniref:MFS transporter n=1 Tax=Ensifer sp. TaxID=1872086 RepID=UPI00289B1EB9|nr:MFS transporter [Ensifer sp.]
MNISAQKLPERAGLRAWCALAVLATTAVLVMMNMSILYLALPTISKALAPSGAQILWIMDAYGLVIAGSLITMGALSDRFGHRRLLLVGSAIFAGASVLAACAPNPSTLIAARSLQGLGAAALAPTSLALIKAIFHEPGQRTLAITIWMVGFLVGGAIGPVIGGLVLTYFAWTAVFLLFVPAMVVLICTAPMLIPSQRSCRAAELDFQSALLSILTPPLIVLSIKQTTLSGFDALTVVALLTALFLTAVFFRRQSRLARPFLPLSILQDRTCALLLVGMTLVGAILFGTSLITSQYLQLVFGFTPLKAGLWQLPGATINAVLAVWVSTLTARYRPQVLMAVGTLVALAGPLLLLLGGQDPLVLVAGSAFLLAGLTPFMSLGTGVFLQAVPEGSAGSASAITETGAELGAALGIAVFGSLATSAYRTYMADRLTGDLPDKVSIAALETLAGAISSAEMLPVDQNAVLVSLAREAFSSSLYIHALTLLPVVLSLSLIALTLPGKTQCNRTP